MSRRKKSSGRHRTRPSAAAPNDDAPAKRTPPKPNPPTPSKPFLFSDLAALYREKEGEIKTSVGLEFSTRPDGMPALENYYNFEVAQACMLIEPVSVPLESLKNRDSDVAMVFGTDAEIAEYGWHVYLDDKSFFPPYDLTPYVCKEVLDRHPEIEGIINELVATFSGGGGPATAEIVAQCQKVWQELNAKVDIGGMEPGEVAHEYLIECGLIKE